MVQEQKLTVYGFTLNEFYEVLEVDHTSPSGLRWRRTVSATAVKGSVAGSYSESVSHPCWRMKFKGTPMVLARVLWFMYYKSVPPEVVDHRNGNTKDHSVQNLRATQQKVNSQNRSVQNQTGVPGVYLREDKYGNLVYRCQGVNIDGSRWSKVFAVGKYGQLRALELAKQYRLNMEDKNDTQTRRRTLDVNP